ncbi:hypothetical protein NQ176_g3343 [Zarea fungicola]|uniref:Uncharacterized protein n=1 Tax=Zarea fungicola TaxID=93591 RepID=A0ACC1NK17_9HYPO|nr:hypothetical protein NQ176_g3343 [Lecanicillium fungicola]
MLFHQVNLLGTALLASLVNAEPIPITERELIPSHECPGAKEGQQEFAIPIADWQALATAIQTNTLSSGPLDDSILIKARHAIVIKAGSAQICVQNDYLTQNAHYSRTEIALAVAQGIYNCCGGDNPGTTCKAKPWLTIKGDTGLKAIATVGLAGDKCVGADGEKDYLTPAQVIFKSGKFFYDIFKPLITGRP